MDEPHIASGSQGRELIALARQAQDDFNAIRRSTSPVKATLIHAATNAEAMGVPPAPIPPQQMLEYGGSAGLRKCHQRFDLTGSPQFTDKPILDVHGQPITDSNGKALDVVMPATRFIFLEGDPDAVKRLCAAAARAGALLTIGCDHAYVSAFAGWQFCRPDDRWWAFVFETAWAGRHPMLRATRRIWARNDAKARVFLPYDIDALRLLAKSNGPLHGEIPPAWLEQLPEAFQSTLDDMASGCADALDVLIQEVEGSSLQVNPAATLLEPTRLRALADELESQIEAARFISRAPAADEHARIGFHAIMDELDRLYDKLIAVREAVRIEAPGRLALMKTLRLAIPSTSKSNVPHWFTNEGRWNQHGGMIVAELRAIADATEDAPVAPSQASGHDPTTRAGSVPGLRAGPVATESKSPPANRWPKAAALFDALVQVVVTTRQMIRVCTQIHDGIDMLHRAADRDDYCAPPSDDDDAEMRAMKMDRRGASTFSAHWTPLLDAYHRDVRRARQARELARRAAGEAQGELDRGRSNPFDMPTFDIGDAINELGGCFPNIDEWCDYPPPADVLARMIALMKTRLVPVEQWDRKLKVLRDQRINEEPDEIQRHDAGAGAQTAEDKPPSRPKAVDHAARKSAIRAEIQRRLENGETARTIKLRDLARTLHISTGWISEHSPAWRAVVEQKHQACSSPAPTATSGDGEPLTAHRSELDRLIEEQEADDRTDQRRHGARRVRRSRAHE